ncbi:MAG: MFS transporter, partial [Chloroflexi bacterium]|nr:MFS transporter [Chloroflexota bacterium]
METARDSVKIRGNRWLTVGVVNITHTFAHLNLGALPVLFPLLRDEFAFGYTGIAVLNMVNQIVRGPVQFTFGFISRFVNRVRVLAIGALVTFLGMLGFAGSQNYFYLVTTRAIWGFGATPNDPLGGSVTADSFPRVRTRALAWHLTAGNIGTWAAPLLVAAMLSFPFLSWRWIILILATPVLLVSLLLFILTDPAPRGEARRGRARAGLAEYKMVLRDRNTMIVAAV